jgi:hypothetical protein
VQVIDLEETTDDIITISREIAALTQVCVFAHMLVVPALFLTVFFLLVF